MSRPVSQIASPTGRPEEVMEPCGIGEGPGLEPGVPIGEPAEDEAADVGVTEPVLDRLLMGLRRNEGEPFMCDELPVVIRALAADADRAGLDAVDRETVKAMAVQLLQGWGIDSPEGRRILAAAFGNGRPTNDQGGVARLHSLAELLEDPEALKPPQVVIPRVAYCGRVSLLIGREKLSGKSTFMTAGATQVSRDGEFLGEPCASGVVLWVSADHEHPSEITQRARRFGANPERFHVLWPHTPITDLMDAIDRLQPILVGVDTLANFARTIVKDPSSSAEWPSVLLPLVAIARERNLAMVVAHHAKKAEGGGYRDSTAIGALVDLLLEITPDAVNPNRRNVAVIGRWPASNFGVELVGDEYQLVAGGDLSLDAQVLLYIEQNPRCSQRSVRDGISKRDDLVIAALNRLRASGAVRNVGSDNRHRYELTTATPSMLDEEADNVPF